MAKRSLKEAKAAPTPEQETEALQRETLELLLGIARKGGPGAVHAIDLIGRLKTNSWWTRPEPAEQPRELSEETVKILLSLPDDNQITQCPRCGFDLAPKLPPHCGCLDCK